MSNNDGARRFGLKKRVLVHRNVGLTILCGDIIAMALAFLSAKQTYLWSRIFLDVHFPEKTMLQSIYMHDLLFVLILPIVLFGLFARGHYTQRVPWWSQVQHLLTLCFMAFVFDGFVRFAFDMSVSRLMISLSWVYLFFLTLLARQVIFMAMGKLKIWRMPVIAIGDVDTLTNLLFAFHTDRYIGFDIEAVFLRDQKDVALEIDLLPARYKNLIVYREDKDYLQHIAAHPDIYYIVSLESFRGADRDTVIGALIHAKALYAIIPPISRINSYEMEPRYFFGYDLMLLHAKSQIFMLPWRILKRGMDAGASGLALILLSPLLIGVALCLKLEGQGGSVFYGGKRIGRYGRHFSCWKFRSMEPNSDHLLHALLERDPQAKSDWELYRKLKQPDPRITTRTARFIRKTSIDELPQLWNVFIGDMSLVGPRPILEDEIPLFGDNIDYYIKVRPGITGLWQVSGRNDTSFQRRVYWDSWYVRNWSLWGDIVILIRTLGVVFGRKGAF